jgi:hypothetical protein
MAVRISVPGADSAQIKRTVAIQLIMALQTNVIEKQRTSECLPFGNSISAGKNDYQPQRHIISESKFMYVGLLNLSLLKMAAHERLPLIEMAIDVSLFDILLTVYHYVSQ